MHIDKPNHTEVIASALFTAAQQTPRRVDFPSAAGRHMST